MDHALLRKSAEALRGSFQELAAAEDATFADLVVIGLRAEQHMLVATGGVNTHRGAIFALGLLVAAAARCGPTNVPTRIRQTLLERWGKDLRKHSLANEASHGGEVRRLTGTGGAREEAALGFPSIFEQALPRFRKLLEAGVPFRSSALETLFLLMANVEDTNVIHRGGLAGGQFARLRARDFLAAGGVSHPEWEILARKIHGEFVERDLSPGGAADLLASTLFLHEVTTRLR